MTSLLKVFWKSGLAEGEYDIPVPMAPKEFLPENGETDLLRLPLPGVDERP